MSSIVNKTIHGVRWNFQSQLITQVVNFAVSILLMRMLLPSDFGRFAMVYVVVNLLHIFRDSQLSQSLIQKVSKDRIEQSSVFWYHIFVSVFIAITLVIVANSFNAYYLQKNLHFLVYWLALDFVLGAIGLVPFALLQMQLNFRAIFYIQLLGVIGSTIAAIGMAYQGWGIYSLVAKAIVWTAIVSIGSWILSRWAPTLNFSLQSIKNLSKFAMPATGNSFLSYISRNVDDFFIGSAIGSTAMGFYNRAYALMLLPIGSLSSVLRAVLFPSWSSIQDNAKQVREMYLRTIGAIAFITFPMMTLLAVLASPLVELFLGEQWIPMVNTLKILSIIGMLQSVGTMVGVIFMVFNQNKLLLKINLATTIVMTFIIIWSVYTFKQIEYVATAYALVSLIFLYPTFHLGGKIIKASFFDMLYPILQPLLIASISAGVSWALHNYFLPEYKIINLGTAILIPIVVYFMLSFVLKSKALSDLTFAIRELKISR